MLDDIAASPVSAKLQAAFHYLRKLTLQPARMTAADADAIYAAGWDGRAVYHLASICALFSFDNRLIQGVGIPPHEAEKLDATADRLHARGYASTVDYIKGE